MNDINDLRHRIECATTKEQAMNLLNFFGRTHTTWCVKNWNLWKKAEDELNYYIWYRWS